MKIRIVILAMLSSVSFMMACDKLLEEDVRSQITDNHLSTPAGFSEGVNAAYSYLRTFYGLNEWGATVTIFGTDEFTHGFDGGNKHFNYYDANLNPRAGIINNVWSTLYTGINACNAVITRAPDVSGISDDAKMVLVAEVRFIRAKLYFLLVQSFGAVHLSLTEVQGIETTAVRSSVSDVYGAIIDDLNFSIQQLPATASQYGRATKPAAEHLLAKVYLTKAGSEARQPDDYASAATLAKNVIHNYDFQLVEDFGTLFDKATEKNSEVVFAVQNSENVLTAGGDGGQNTGSSTLHAYFLMKYDDLPGMERDLENGRPWARYRPTRWVIETLFDRSLDDRYDKSFQKRVFYCNRPGTYTINGRSVTLERGDTAVYLLDTDWTAEEINSKNYNVWGLSRQNERVYMFLSKFLDSDRLSVNDMRSSRDVVIFRLAETCLIAAEALMMDGKPEEAVEYVNIVRRRAAKRGATESETQANRLAMVVDANQLDIDFILDERSRELLGEMMRWFDLARTGKLVERVKKYNPNGAPNVQPHHVLRPIPQNQIDRTDGEFPQNDGYF